MLGHYHPLIMNLAVVLRPTLDRQNMVDFVPSEILVKIQRVVGLNH